MAIQPFNGRGSEYSSVLDLHTLAHNHNLFDSWNHKDLQALLGITLLGQSGQSVIKGSLHNCIL